MKPTILIGVSAVGGLFTETVIRNMAKKVDRPIILPLSNPTDKAECMPEQAYAWTDGRALVAAGVQFPDVRIDGKTFHPGQANNFYIFPAIGLAVYATRPKRIDDRMFIEAARGSGRFESQVGVVAWLVPATATLETQSKNNRGGRDEPGHDKWKVIRQAGISQRSVRVPFVSSSAGLAQRWHASGRDSHASPCRTTRAWRNAESISFRATRDRERGASPAAP